MFVVCGSFSQRVRAWASLQQALLARQSLPWRVFLASLIALSLGCSSDPVKQEITRVASPVDMSGHWEMDYAKSDNLQDQLNAVVRQIRREAARREQLAKEGRGFAGAPLRSTRSNYPRAPRGNHNGADTT